MSQRVVLAKVGLDGHDRGIKVIARGLRDAGFHVIYAGIWQSPESVAQAVADEDADWLGISLLNGAHMALIPRVIEQLRAFGVADVGVILGGIIPVADAEKLQEQGVAASFGPGTRIAKIVDVLNSRTRLAASGAEAVVTRCGQRDRRALSRLLTWLAEGQEIEAIRRSLQSMNFRSGRPIAVTGSAGVGKSSLIARLISEFRAVGRTVAVLSCDPQSPITGGALLGDRIRMSGALQDLGVFIRSLAAPSGSQGIAINLDLMSQALALFGFDVILIETVGTGQGDVAVRSFAETVVALVQPESGDSIQWEKAGLLEIADIVVVHKSDLPGADQMIADLTGQFDPAAGRTVPVVPISSSDRVGLMQLIELLQRT